LKQRPLLLFTQHLQPVSTQAIRNVNIAITIQKGFHFFWFCGIEIERELPIPYKRCERMFLQLVGILIEARGIARVESIARGKKIVIRRGERGEENKLERDEKGGGKLRDARHAEALKDSEHTCYIKACGAVLRR